MLRNFRNIFLCLVIITACCVANDARSQNPLVKMWDYRYGGTYPDALSAFQQTRDGGFILAGYSNSGANGDKSQPTYGDYDYWIVKLNAQGIKEWDADFGGTDYDELTCVCQTADGGYLLGGYSLSNAGGCKTQNNWDVAGLTNDFWIVKTDSLGVKQWDKDFGGLDEDKLISIAQVYDGGYIIGGVSNSDAGGDKSQASQGNNDYWILRLDPLGNKLWDKTFGGINLDNLHAVRPTPDHCFILGGLSNSPATGDKTYPLYGGYDFWILKVDSIGNFLWDKEYGGGDNDYLWSMEVTHDDGFIMGGITFSSIGGNKTTPLWLGGGGTGIDYWAIKTDSAGNVQWQRDLGGTADEDEFGNLSVGGDGGYVFGGTSYSLISGDKSENNLGTEQGWFVKVDSLGVTQYDKTIALNSHDENGYAIQTKEGCYAFAHFNGAPVGGLKSQPPQGVYDYWIVRFCDSTQIPVSAFASVNPICPGTCVNFLNLSLNATSYQWLFPGATPAVSNDINPTGICYNSPGDYDVTLIASSAISNDTLTLHNFVSVFPYPPPQGITQVGDTLFANPGAVSYQWFYFGSPVNGATDYFYNTILDGDYSVVATDINGCEVEAVVFDVMDIQAAGQLNAINIFPNPVNEKLILKLNSQITAPIKILICNLLGETVMQLNSSDISTMTTIDVHSLREGMYWLEVNSGHETKRIKFIKTNCR